MAKTSAHRVRHRSSKPVSALKGMALFGEKPQERLNAQTPHVTRCAWPGCRAQVKHPSIDGAEPRDARYGVLCDVHAVDVAIAVLQHQKDLRRMQEFFEMQSTATAVRVSQWRAEEARDEAAKAALRQDREGFVYYIRMGDRLKIGYSVDVKRRMRAYPPASELLAVEPGDRDLERARHRQFAGSLAYGREWFTPTPDIQEHIDAVLAEHGEPPRRFAHHYTAKRQPMRVRRRD